MTRVATRLPDPHQMLSEEAGNWTRAGLHYRYVCKCGRTGPWRLTSDLARGDHAVHAYCRYVEAPP